jgi:thioredoxin 2
MNEEFFIITCPHCGAKNRVPKSRINDRPVCGKCKTPLKISTTHDRPITLTEATFRAEVVSFPGVVLIDCWAPWCGPCHMVSPIVEQIASEYAGRIKVGKIDIDQNPTIASQFQIQSIPTLLLFKNGKLVDRLIGALPKNEIEKRLIPIL